MSKAKTKIINKEKCDKLMKEITEDRKFYAYIHKVMINTHSDYNGLSKIIELNDFKSECWLKIYKSLDLYDSNKSTLKTFCITCIKSTALMELRKSKSSKNLLYNPDFKVSLDEEIRDTHECTFAEILEGKEDEYFVDDFKKEIIEAFDKLAPSECQALILKVQGYTNEEISKIMNITYNNTANKIAKARKKLRQILNYNK